jgi:RNA polymerase-binding transcription factor
MDQPPGVTAMNVETQTHLATLRQLLDYRLHDLETEVRAQEAARRQPQDRGVMDRKEEAEQQHALEVGDAEESRDVDELQQVKRALQRLDAGTYGDCTDCGEPIPLQRLLVQPAAQRCAACQAVAEHRPQRMS